jgi:cytochrome c oxidase assembly protein subunit 15
MWLNRFARFLVFCTFFLIIVGALVTSNDAGLSVPDWPKSYGMWMPPMIGNVFYEHGHRMVASFVGFLTIILAIWLWRSEPRKWVRNLGLLALLTVIAQGLLGGLTVIFLLPTPISLLHATLAQTFFCLVVSIALFTSNEWFEPSASKSRRGGAPLLFAATTLAVYIQLILGSWIRHSKAALAIPDFPLSLGRVIPPFTTPEIAIHFAHRAWAMVVFVLILASFLNVVRNYRNEKKLLRPAILLLALICAQITLGGYTVLTKTAVYVSTAHVAVGAIILATSLVLTLRGYRILSAVAEASPAMAKAQLKTV